MRASAVVHRQRTTTYRWLFIVMHRPAMTNPRRTIGRFVTAEIILLLYQRFRSCLSRQIRRVFLIGGVVVRSA